MVRIVLSFMGEGKTDDRFIANIAERLVEGLLIQNGIEATIEWHKIIKKSGSAADTIFNAALQSKHCTMLILHADADNHTNKIAYENKIMPGLELISKTNELVCDNIAIVIPIAETEAWMLVDKELLKEEINTTLTDNELGLTYTLNRIENINDPKQKIIEAIHIHTQTLERKRRKYAVTLSEIYEPISKRISLSKLEVLSAYLSFKEEIIRALKVKHILAD